MARPLRIEYPGAYYHVISRGIGRESIYRNYIDREKFLAYLETASERFSIVIHTYCLMRNHYHLLLETPESNLSQSIQWLNVSYATYFNKKHKRSGHLFQGRFKAILVDADRYLKQLSRYIHLNPVKAKIVDSPGQYRWSSYPAFAGRQTPPVFLETNWLLSSFGKRKKEARKNYIDFVEGVDTSKLENPGRHITAGLILGDSDFIDWVKDTFLSDKKVDKEIPQLKKLKPRISTEAVVEKVGKAFNCNADLILQKGRKRNKAREVAIYFARNLTGISCKDLGSYFGGVSGALITIMHHRIEKEANENKQFDNKLKKIKNQIFNI
ncbi:MAG: transposase [Deltaproteobacteria bacterium]|jgi:REP element-mobilizing transposase RayT|nr:transposase [Deltaproteobacteria bacterium]